MFNHADQHLASNIGNFEKLKSLFDHPPSFDDAEVVEMYFNRGNTLECAFSNNWELYQPPFLQVQFYLFDNFYSREDPRANACHIILKFFDIQEFNLINFRHQNPICDFSINKSFNDRLKKYMLEVSWGGAGHEVEFICAEIQYLGLKN